MNPTSRIFSVSVRQSLLQMYGGGEALGQDAARRALWEIGDCMADLHGRDKAATALYRVADTIATSGDVGQVWPAAADTSSLGSLESAVEQMVAKSTALTDMIDAHLNAPKPEVAAPAKLPFVKQHCIILIFAAFYSGLVIGGLL